MTTNKSKTKTVSLQMIVKDEVAEVTAIVEQANAHVDAIRITATHVGSYDSFVKMVGGFRKIGVTNVHLDSFTWVNDFALARNHNISSCVEDYYFWVDADDEFDFSTIRGLVNYAENNDYQAIYLPYNYAYDDNGRCVARHWRERLLNAKTGFQWRGALHETLIIDKPFRGKRLEEPAVIHKSPDIQGSIARNHAILEAKAAERPVDPRYLHYLGLSYFTLGDYQSCINVLADYLKVGGWDEEIYRSLLKMSEASSLLNNGEDARNYALQAAGILPYYPQAYLNLAQYEFADEQYKECLEWLMVGLEKPQPESMSVFDPTMFERAKVIGACSEFQLGHYRDAEAILKTCDDPAVPDLIREFAAEASKERFIEIFPAIVKHLDERKLWEALPDNLKYDQRLQYFRYAVNGPKQWPKKSIVYFVGQGYEEWGPHTLDKGMGGSEEAVINLSREWAKLGYKVTIFGAVNEEIKDGDVTYLPWREFDPRDTFDTLIVWRAPHGVDKLNARVKIVDLHDVLPPKDVQPLDDVTYFVKSQYQRELYKDLPNEQFHIIGNGIQKEHFNG